MTINKINIFQKVFNRTKNLRFSVMRIFARFIFFRKIHELLQFQNPSEYRFNESIFKNLDITAIVNELKIEGYSLGINLPTSYLNSILDYAKKSPCYGDSNYQQGFLYKDKALIEKNNYSFMSASYPNLIKNCSSIKAVSNDPQLFNIAKQYLGFSPKLLNVQMWWVFPKESTDIEKSIWAQKFHHDIDDYKFVKFFFYLTDVDIGSAPHSYVSRSHVNKKFRHQLSMKRIEDKDIYNDYGKEKVVSIYGKAGLGFVGDTYCIHKATSPISKDRLLLQLQFGKNDYQKNNIESTTNLSNIF